MLRAILVAVVLVAAPLAAVAMHGQDQGYLTSAPDEAPTPAAVPASDRVVIDTSSLPRPTGWLVVPVYADERAPLQITGDLSLDVQDRGPAGGSTFVAELGPDGQPRIQASGDLDTRSQRIKLHHDGRQAGCCAPASERPDLGGGEAGRVAWAGPETPAYVGIVVVNATNQTSAEITVEPAPGPAAENVTISTGEPSHGTDARAVNLVEEARRRGTNADLGHTVVGETARANLSTDASQSAFTFLTYEVDERADANLALHLANGTSLSDVLPTAGEGEITALSGPGEATVALSNLTDPARRPASDSSDTIRAHALAADLPIPLEAIERRNLTTDRVETFRENSGGEIDLVLHDDQLPAATGWFLVPIEAEQNASVHLQIVLGLDDTDDQAKVAVPIIAQHDRVRTMLFAAGQEPTIEAHAQDHKLGCCTDRYNGRSGAADWSTWTGTAPETPLFVGLAVSGWTSTDNLTIHVASDDADLRAGPTRTGTGVQAVDLFDEAAQGEPGLRVGGQRVAGDLEDVRLDWRADQTGLLSIGWALEDARGDVHVQLPSGERADTVPSQDTAGTLTAASGPGSVELAFTNASRSGDHEDDRPSGRALALFADLALPYRDLRVDDGPA